MQIIKVNCILTDKKKGLNDLSSFILKKANNTSVDLWNWRKAQFS